jgi:hypothetical protein
MAALGRYGRQPYDVMRDMLVTDRRRLYEAVIGLVERENEKGADPTGEDY